MENIFDLNFFQKLNTLKLNSYIRTKQGMSGERKSGAKGSSVEFSDYREYFPGDDLRRIDWNVYGRTEKLYIKEFMEEKEIPFTLFLDTSASMDFGEQKKSVMALRLAAVFAWLVLKQLDRVEILTLRDGRLGKTSPVTGRGSFQKLLNELEQVTFEGKTRINEAVRRSSFNGRGICILISDFLDPEGIDEAIRYLTFKKQEVLLIQVLAREEVNFEGEGTLALEDMETGEQVRVTMTRQTLKVYEEALEAHNQALQKLAKRYGCAWQQVVADEDLEKVVFHTLKQKGIFG